jgi:hypothetical protein
MILHGHNRKGFISATYLSWRNAKQRCHNQKNPAYKNYGGRGIQMCQEWRESFAVFMADMGEKPKGMQLERIDNNKGYMPGNCRWASPIDQANNKTTSRYITYAGKTMTMSQWSIETNISISSINTRLKRGWTPELIFKYPQADPWLLERLGLRPIQKRGNAPGFADSSKYRRDGNKFVSIKKSHMKHD